MLRLNGYSTSFFGKNHETAAWEVSPSGPTTRWPNRSGFDEFYGFMGGETNQWAPLLYHGMNRVELPKDPNYHFMTDMTNKAVALGAVPEVADAGPAVLHVLRAGRDARAAPRAEGVDRQVQGQVRRRVGRACARRSWPARSSSGVVPAGTKLAPKPEAIKDWAALSADEKKLFARQMEIYAGFGEYTDVEIGRLVDALKDLGQLDNTLVFYIVGDNGTSAEGGMNGMFNEMTYFNGVQETAAGHPEALRRAGRPDVLSTTWPPAGRWRATRRSRGPSRWRRTSAARATGWWSYWPKRITAKGEVRSQFHHVIDVAPTVLEAAGLPEPKVVNGTPQKPIEGVSMVYTFDDAKAEGRHKVQYFEMIGNRAIYADGWFAGTIHKAPWEAKPRAALLDDKWELYDTRTDFSLANDLAAQNPGKLKELQDLFMKEAAKYNVLPIDDRSIERLNRQAGRTARSHGRPHVAHPLCRHDRHERERVHQREEPFADDHRRRGDPGRRRQRRHPRAGRTVRRVEPLHEGRQARLRLQLPRASSGSRWPPHRRFRRARRRSGSSSPTTAAAWPRAAWARST